MDDKRKAAYRYMLYWMLVDLRQATPWGTTWLQALGNLLELDRYRKQIHWSHYYADAFHNLAYFSAKDFEGFDEDHFWKADFAILQRYCHDGKLLRKTFNEIASGERSL